VISPVNVNFMKV